MNHVIMCSKVNHGVPQQWTAMSDNNSECVPISSRDGASKRDQHEPDDRLRDTCKFTSKEFNSFFSSEWAAELFDACNQQC